jgi:IS5 family transposase
MNCYRPDRIWSSYNARLVQQGAVSLFVHRECVRHWVYEGPRKPGGKIVYPDAVIETCLLVGQMFRLPLRQCQGFVQSLLDALGTGLRAPDYTTLCRRAARLEVRLDTHRRSLPLPEQGRVLAIDATGLRLYSGSDWHRHRRREDGPRWQDKWRKLHLVMDTASGLIVTARMSPPGEQDCTQAPDLLTQCPGKIAAVAGDCAYDTVRVRTVLHRVGARQLIPPNRRACPSQNNRALKVHAAALAERDAAVAFLRLRREAGLSPGEARKAWKVQAGYHVRSLVETTMSQIKLRADDRLSARTEPNRQTQSLLKCKLVNTLILA